MRYSAAIFTLTSLAAAGWLFAQEKPDSRLQRLQRGAENDGGALGGLLQNARVLRSAPPWRTVDPRTSPFVLSRDTDAELWLKKARQAGERQEWKLAVDTLWRVIDRHAEAIVSLDERSGESAGEAAWSLLRSWPPAALETYRTLFEPEAGRLLEEAEQRGEIEAIRRITRRYLLTDAGRRALDLLATWALDEGRPFEAAAALHKLERIERDAAALRLVRLRLIVAEAMAGRRDYAAALLSDLRADGSGALPRGVDAATWDAWLDAVAREVASVDGIRRPGATLTWRGLLGGGDGLGRMPAVSPSQGFLSNWRTTLPGMTSTSSEALSRLCHRYGIGPVWQCAAEGARLFVRYPSGVMALDTSTFEPIWRTSSKPQPRGRPRVMRAFVQWGGEQGAAQPAAVLEPVEIRALSDELAGVIGVEAGLVFAIEPPRELTDGSAVFQQLGGGFAGGVVDPNGDSFSENTLLAFDAVTGKAVWSKGAEGPLSDGLSSARFVATPVTCGEGLVAPFVSGDNFALAVIEPGGRLIRTQVIGTAPQSAFPGRSVLPVGVSESMLYVPTGCGALLALDGDDLSLRWVGSYERVGTVESGERISARTTTGEPILVSTVAPVSWASNPPVITGQLVLLAPPDSSQLLAFDRDSGALRWTSPRQTHRYIVGADAARVFLSGSTVAAVWIENGEPAWEYAGPRPCGRVALSGQRLLVPTRRGLVTLDSVSGAVLEEPSGDAEQSDLGNLLAWDGSLYNLTATELERIPDIEQSLASSMRRLESQPGDADALLRMAVLFTQRGELSRAHEALARARQTPASELGPHLQDQIAHQWVEVELAMAGEASDFAARAERLSSAEQAAVRASDELRVGLAQLDNEAASGQVEAAFRRGLRLIGRVGREPVALEGGLVCRGWIPTAERLERLWNDASAVRERLVEVIDESLSAGVLDRVTASDAVGFCELAASLDLAIGGELRAAGAVESAEFYLRRAARRAESHRTATASGVAAAALLELAALQLDPSAGIPRPDAAGETLSRLLDQYADAPVSAAGGKTTAREAAESLGRSLPGGSAAAFLAARSAAPSFEQWGVVQELAGQSNDPSQVAAVTPAGPGSDLALISTWGRVSALDLSAEDAPLPLAWTCELGDALGLLNSLFDGFVVSQRRLPRSGTVSGGVAMVPVEKGLAPIGVSTGRQVGPTLVTPPGAGDPEPRAVAAQDWFVAALNEYTLVGWPARAWSGPAWQRELRRFSIGSLATADGLVVVRDRAETEILVLKPWSGRTQARIRFVQKGEGGDDADDGLGPMRSALVGGFVCAGRESSVSAWHVASGRALWQREMPGQVLGVKMLDDRTVGVSCARGRFVVMDASDGRERARLQLSDVLLPPVAAVLERDRLVMSLLMGPNSPQTRLMAFDLSTGSLSWVLGPLSQALVNDAMLRTSPHVIPYVESVQVAQSQDGGNRGLPMIQRTGNITGRVHLLDKTTGSRVGMPIVLSGELMPTSGQVFDVVMFANRAMVTSASGCYILGRLSPETLKALDERGQRTNALEEPPGDPPVDEMNAEDAP